MSSVTESRKARGNAKGCITRSGNSVAVMLKAEANTLDLAAIVRIRESLDRADDTYQINHECLHEEHEQMEPDDYFQELEEHNLQVMNLRAQLTSVEARVNAALSLSQVEAAMSELELTARDGFTAQLLVQLPEVRVAYKDFRNASAHFSITKEIGMKESRESLSTRYAAIFKLCEPHMPSVLPPGTVPLATPSKPAAAPLSAIKAVVPQFDGKLEHWRTFWDLFNSILESNSHLTSQQKRALLVKSMSTPEATQQAQQALDITATFDEAVQKMKETYDDPVQLHLHHVTQYFQPEHYAESRSDMIRLLNHLQEHLAGIKASNGYTAEQIMAAYGATLLPQPLLVKWKLKVGDVSVPPTQEQLIAFVRSMIHATADLPSVSPRAGTSPSATPTMTVPRKRILPKPPTRSAMAIRRSVECRVCSGDHSVFGCSRMTDMTVAERLQWAQEARVCLNFFSSTHTTDRCGSSNRCKVCHRPHHTLIHRSSDKETPTEASACAVSQQTGCTLYAHSNHSVPITASVRVRATGLIQMGRAHFDTGANITLMTREFANKLKVRKIPRSGSNVTGVFASLKTLYQTKIHLLGSPKVGRGHQSVSIIAHVVESIPAPASQVDMKAVRDLPFLKDLPLADPQYVPGAKVDLLLEVAAVTVCGLKKIRYADDVNLEAKLTMFGWTVGGSYHPAQQSYQPTACFASLIPPPPPPPPPPSEDADLLLRRFWETEPDDNMLSTSVSPDDLAVAHFQRTHKRDATGRYFVSLPRLAHPPLLGASHAMALRRFLANEKALQRKHSLQPYRDAVAEYMTLNHAELVPGEDLCKPEHQTYYLPMHGVFKSSSTSTKLRPVCDASAKTSTGASLNDQLLTGPSTYPRVWSLINRFRSHPIVLTADISKMYRQVGLNPDERDFHRFLHRDEQDTIRPHQMTRLTFGVSCSPSIATQVLHQVADDHYTEYPRAAEVLRKSFYVDDLLTGSDSIDEAQHLRRDLNCLLDKAGMTLCKWRTNSPELRKTIPPQLLEPSDLTLSPHPDQALKALGIHWDSKSDMLFVAVPDTSSISIATKRSVASTFARIFDPLGWFGPATIPAKLLLQQSWNLQLEWDSPLPTDLQKQWLQWITEIPFIHSHPIPRFFNSSTETTVDIQLHGFTDASLVAFGGVVYTRRFNRDTSVSVTIVSSRSKLAPVGGQTVPRLELCGALIVAQLLASVAKDLSITTASLFAWTDSAIVLGWLNQDPATLDTFVGNRIRKILELVPSTNWRYVSTRVNPADILSRGESPKTLCDNPLWWHGPTWLVQQPASWPRRSDINLSRELPPVGPPVVLSTTPGLVELTTEFWNFSKLTRVFAWVNRFVRGTRRQQPPPTSLQLSIQELRESSQTLLKHTQQVHYAFELDRLTSNRPLPKGNRLKSLAPFIDSSGILRVGGRIQQSLLSTINQHPIILHAQSHTIRLMLQRTHKTMLHAGSSTMMAVLGCTYYIPRLKSYLKSLTHSCSRCLRTAARTTQVLMGQLPATRVQPSPPFSHVGVDFAGPFSIRRGYMRKPAHVKTYLCLFVCFTTKAVHIEVASDLSTATFIACLTRFVGRRGYPTHLYSDNGSNFLGAEPHITQTKSNHPPVISSTAISNWAASTDIQWSFSPPKGPHHGGLWEAGIKAMKKLLGSSITNGLLTFEELVTLSIEVEAILNSRPLIPIDSPSSDPVDVLTPGHFLVGRPLTALPYHHDLNQRFPLLRRWNLVERLAHSLWQRWKEEYLRVLQKRNKWQDDPPPLNIGDIVMVKDTQTFQRDWPLAVIVNTYPGPDNRVRVVDLRSGPTIMKRPVSNLVKLMNDPSSPSPGEDVQVPTLPALAAPPLSLQPDYAQTRDRK